MLKEHVQRIECKNRLERAERKLRGCGPHGRYEPLWGYLKAATACGYDDYDVLYNMASTIYLQQWQEVPEYVADSVKHALAEANVPVNFDKVKIEKSKALSSLREKYAEFTPEFEQWVKDKILPQNVFPVYEGLSEKTEDELRKMSEETMRKIVGDIPDGAYLYVGQGMWDSKGIDGKDSYNVGFWRKLDIPNDDDHKSWCPNMMTSNSRSKDTVKEVKFLVMEMDRALVDNPNPPKTKASLDFGYETAQRYWQYILGKKCLSIKALVFSGSKSIHAIIPVSCTKEEFFQKQARIKAGYLKMYMDDSMVDCAKKTRRPWGIRVFAQSADGRLCELQNYRQAKKKADAGDLKFAQQIKDLGIDEANNLAIVQELLYLDENAKPMTLDEFCDGMKAIYSEYIAGEADEISDAEKKAQEPMPLVWQEKENELGEKTGKWVWEGNNIDPFLKNVGISKYDMTDKAQGMLARDEKTGIIRDIGVNAAWDIVYNYVKNKSVSMSSELRDVYSKRFTDKSMAIYTGNKTSINLLWDTADVSYIPYRNGILKVTATTTELIPYDSRPEGDTWGSAPTLKRDWKDAPYAGCEMETLVKHISGSELEDKDLASKRYDKIQIALGYMVTRYKEHTNYAVIFTDETIQKDSGGSGKSLLLKAVLHMRYGYLREPNEEAATQFQFSVITKDMNILGIDETSTDFAFRDFFTKTTANWNVEHKFVDGKEIIPYEYAPKIMICTNNLPSGLGGSHERRKRIFEVSHHYHADGVDDLTPYDEFGHRLYDDWGAEEWARFDAYMVHECLQKYMKVKKLCNGENVNVETKKLIYNVPEDIIEFFEDEYITLANEGVRLQSRRICREYETWCNTNGHKHIDYSTRKLNTFVERYCEVKGIRDEYKSYKINERADGIDTEVSRVCHCFYFPKSMKAGDSTLLSDAVDGGNNAHDQSRKVTVNGAVCDRPECLDSPDVSESMKQKLGIKDGKSPF
jgi:hypothetical protein